MPVNYESDPVWGSDYRRALATGDQAHIARLRAAIDARPQSANTAGQIMAQTADMGRGSNVWANGYPGQQVNAQGQIRNEQAARGWNITPGAPGGTYTFRGQYGQSPSQITGQATPTTPRDYPIPAPTPYSGGGGGMLGSPGPQFGPQRMPGASNAANGYMRPYTGLYGQTLGYQQPIQQRPMQGWNLGPFTLGNRQMYGASPTGQSSGGWDQSTMNRYYRGGLLGGRR